MATDTPRCQWLGCAQPGPYAGHKALHEHLKAAHNPAKSDDAVFVCKWAGCAHVSAGLQSRMQHLGRHTEYRPYICSHAGCKKAYTCSQDLNVHRRRHRAVVPQAECTCEWAGCGATFPGAAELRAHLDPAHAAGMKRGLRCGWARCGHVFAGGNFKSPSAVVVFIGRSSVHYSLFEARAMAHPAAVKRIAAPE